MMISTSCKMVEAYITTDGSSIRKLIHSLVHGNAAQSLADATVPAGSTTLLHRHKVTEEIYRILSGCGMMTLGKESILVEEGESICIHPGTPHNIKNIGDDEFRLLSCLFTR